MWVPVEYRAAHFKTRRFFKKHGDLSVFVGALIVFFTFIAREGLGEQWREVAEAIDTAEYRYSVRVDTYEGKLKIEELGRKISTLSKGAAGQGKTDASNTSLQKQHTEASRVMLDNIQSKLAILRALVERLPDNLDAMKRVLNFQLEHAKAGLESAYIDADRPKAKETGQFVQMDLNFELIGKQPRKPDPNAKWSYSSPNSMFYNLLTTGYPGENRDIEFEHSVSDLDRDVDFFKDDLLKQAEQVRKNNETYANFARFGNWFLFVLGWGLGLLGKLYGVPDAADGGE